MFRLNPYSIIYRWWDEYSLEHSALPILESIKTVRHHKEHVPIIVLDHSIKEHNWNFWKNHYKIEVIKLESQFQNCKLQPMMHKKLLGKPFDLLKIHDFIQTEGIIFLDSDVFMVNDMSVIVKDKIQCTGNTGLIIYRKNQQTLQFFQLWTGLILLAIESKDFRTALFKAFPSQTGLLEDEIVFRYLCQITNGQFNDFIDNRYNYFISHETITDGRVSFPTENQLLTEPVINIHIRTLSDALSKIAVAMRYEEIARIIG